MSKKVEKKTRKREEAVRNEGIGKNFPLKKLWEKNNSEAGKVSVNLALFADDNTGLGEIATRGRNACMGYLWEEGKTAELIDAEGYVLSGDLGRFEDPNGAQQASVKIG